ncbi:MAG: hypothetical protein EOM20_12215 [Spartobacteria bacterium]|nr:hypothetical protein [Spartobacteria bacterium]
MSKKEKIEHAGIAIREVRAGYWLVDYRRDGLNERRCFDDLADAKLYAEMVRRKIQNEGVAAFELSPTQRLDAARALKVLAGRSSLVDAARAWVKSNADLSGVPVADVVEKFMIEKEREGCRASTLGERRYKLNRFKDAFECPLRTVKSEAIAAWMDDLGLTGSTRDGYRRCLRAFFSFAVDEGFCEAIPKSLLKKIRTDDVLPDFFTVDQVRTLFSVLEEKEPSAIPYLAAQFFGGLRPGEAAGLKWDQVDLAEKIIRVLPETSKVRGARVIEMNDALFDWLVAYRGAGGMGIAGKHEFNRMMKRIKPDLGFSWKQDGGRKTFATMHMALHGDQQRTASILGHVGGADVLYRHYRGLATKKQAQSYFKIRPKQESNVIELRGLA